jgi:hypothetical protein
VGYFLFFLIVGGDPGRVLDGAKPTRVRLGVAWQELPRTQQRVWSYHHRGYRRENDPVWVAGTAEKELATTHGKVRSSVGIAQLGHVAENLLPLASAPAGKAVIIKLRRGEWLRGRGLLWQETHVQVAAEGMASSAEVVSRGLEVSSKRTGLVRWARDDCDRAGSF